jgi:hypothetical protein
MDDLRGCRIILNDDDNQWWFVILDDAYIEVYSLDEYTRDPEGALHHPERVPRSRVKKAYWPKIKTGDKIRILTNDFEGIRQGDILEVIDADGWLMFALDHNGRRIQVWAEYLEPVNQSYVDVETGRFVTLPFLFPMNDPMTDEKLKEAVLTYIVPRDKDLAEECNQETVDPITMESLEHPVVRIGKDCYNMRHVEERGLDKWLETHTKNPKTNSTLTPDELYSLRQLTSRVNDIEKMLAEMYPEPGV